MEHSTRNLIIALIIIGGFLAIHFWVIGHVTSGLASASVSHDQSTPYRLPDFAAINDIKTRKHTFFDYLRPLIAQENQRLAELRRSVDTLSANALKALADDYGLASDSANLKAKLKRRIDQVPSSLVLAQAAIESAWGTSRFAQQGNNLFGQWCFTRGCGMVPRYRAEDANHEVRRFASSRSSIRSYMHNLNTHRAYAKVRSQRADQRARGETLSGCYLAEGLESYSEKGRQYVSMVKSMIRINRLEDHKKYCAPRVIAQPETTPGLAPEPAAEPAADDAA